MSVSRLSLDYRRPNRIILYPFVADCATSVGLRIFRRYLARCLMVGPRMLILKFSQIAFSVFRNFKGSQCDRFRLRQSGISVCCFLCCELFEQLAWRGGMPLATVTGVRIRILTRRIARDSTLYQIGKARYNSVVTNLCSLIQLRTLTLQDVQF